MQLTDFIQLGIGGILAVIIWLIVQRFLKFAELQERNFTNVITNHLEEQKKAYNELTAVIKELLKFLENQNGKDGNIK